MRSNEVVSRIFRALAVLVLGAQLAAHSVSHEHAQNFLMDLASIFFGVPRASSEIQNYNATAPSFKDLKKV